MISRGSLAAHCRDSHTGDLAVIHPDGYVEFKDRAKDVIISGENLSSLEVEWVNGVIRVDQTWTHSNVLFNLDEAVTFNPSRYKTAFLLSTCPESPIVFVEGVEPGDSLSGG